MNAKNAGELKIELVAISKKIILFLFFLNIERASESPMNEKLVGSRWPGQTDRTDDRTNPIQHDGVEGTLAGCDQPKPVDVARNEL